MDHSIPPSYFEATSRDWLPIVAPYLSTSDLLSAGRVSSKWNRVLMPWLWSDPVSRFRPDGAQIHVALTRFNLAVIKARLKVRLLVHTLHLPSSSTRWDYYDQLSRQWLRHALDRLPNLRCLAVSGTPFFDHAALVAVRGETGSLARSSLVNNTRYSLRLLIATSCENCTGASLAQALFHFPTLVFLDLSNTTGVREDNALLAIAELYQLQILKLRRLGLQDRHVKLLAEAIHPVELGHPDLRYKHRLRSLDVRDNFITDVGLRIIEDRLVNKTRNIHDSPGPNRSGRDSDTVQKRTSDRLKRADIDDLFIHTLTQGAVERVNLDELDRIGLTHLYIAGNPISTAAIINIVSTGNLCVLDVGSLSSIFIPSRAQAYPVSTVFDNRVSAAQRMERLVHQIERYSARSLTYLRVNHTLVTGIAGEIPQESTELPFRSGHISGASEHQGFRIPPRQDLALNAHQNHDSAPQYEPTGTSTDHGKVAEDFKPEKEDTQDNDEWWLQEHPPAYDTSYAPKQSQTLTSSAGRDLEDTLGLTVTTQADSMVELQKLIDKRQDLRYGPRSVKRGLLPGRLPALETLVLTELTTLSRSSLLVQNLKNFLNDCAAEHRLATEQARLEAKITKMKRAKHAAYIRDRTKQLFALQTLVLEISPPRSAEPSQSEMSRKESKMKTASAVHDSDVDTLWAASQNDFSFFGDDDSSDLTSEPLTTAEEEPEQPLRDVVAEIARYRAEKRLQYQDSPPGTFVPGYWPGEIKIVRTNPRVTLGDEEMYGGYFGRATEKRVL